jgi:hypothetical protein
MASSPVTINGTIQIVPTPHIEWKIGHNAKVDIIQISVSGGIATILTSTPHLMNVTDTFTLDDNAAIPISGIQSIITPYSFTYNTSAIDGTYPNGYIVNNTGGKEVTKYKIEKFGYNNMWRLSYISGDEPRFTDFGVAVDDIIVLSGDTFSSNNNGTFRILGVTNTEVIYQNSTASEQLNTIKNFNDKNISVTWTTASDTILGLVGAFKNVSIGDWVKQREDEDSEYRQVIYMQDDLGADQSGSPELATRIILGSVYGGLSNDALGVAWDQNYGVETGFILQNVNDIRFLEGDSVRINDSLSIDEIVHDDWFDPNNSGVFNIDKIGTDNFYRPYIQLENKSGVIQSDVLISVKTNGIIITEGTLNRFSTIKEIAHIAIDEFDKNKRIVYLTPGNRRYKFSQSNMTTITSTGKLSYDTNIRTGVDGYLYYTGLLRTVQRIVDGFEPDENTYSGRKAIGGIVEILPPIIKKVYINLDITTNEGVNIDKINSDIKSTVINYVNNLGIGKDVILSEVIRRVKSIIGIEAVTFITPSPNEERIAIADTEKAFIEISNIGVS